MKLVKRCSCFALAAGITAALLTGCGGSVETMPTGPLPTETFTITEDGVEIGGGLYTLDHQGNIIRQDYDYHYPGGSTEVGYVCYDTNGNVIEEVLFRYNQDGSLGYQEEDTYVYDADGHVIAHTHYYMYDESSGYDVLGQKVVTEYQYDAQGDMTYRHCTNEKTDEHGEWSKNFTNEVYYQKYGTESLIVKKIETDEDGVETYEYTYNPQGVITAFNSDQMSHTYEYNDRGLIARIEEREQCDGYVTTTVTEYEYDAQDRIVRELHVMDRDDPELPDSQWEISYEYNEQGWLLQECKVSGSDEDLITYTYDGDGNCIQVELIHTVYGQIYEPYCGIFTPDSTGAIWGNNGCLYYPIPDHHPTHPDWDPTADPNN